MMAFFFFFSSFFLLVYCDLCTVWGSFFFFWDWDWHWRITSLALFFCFFSFVPLSGSLGAELVLFYVFFCCNVGGMSCRFVRMSILSVCY
jgi:hypothetical protein